VQLRQVRLSRMGLHQSKVRRSKVKEEDEDTIGQVRLTFSARREHV